MYHGAWLGMGWMWLFWLVVVVVLVILAVRGFGPGRRGAGGSESAEEVLKRRYARGEIDREQYERMLEELRR